MAFYLKKKKTKSTPYVLIDEVNRCMEFEGDSFPENAIEFFGDIKLWLNEYLESDYGTFVFECKLNYFNSSTAKVLFDMMALMDEYSAGENQATVNWHIAKDNRMMIELYEDFQEDFENLKMDLFH